MAAITSHIPSLRRQIKNVACNYSDAQVKVREATSNDPWGASSSLMSEIADLTYNAMAFTEIMQMIWKRLNDHGKNWRHVYKSLVLLDYLIKVGSEKVAQQCRENVYAIQTLKDFQHIEDNKDQGMNVREKAKQLVALLKDEERLKNERAKALMARKRFTQLNGAGVGSDGRRYEMSRSDSELEECRPTSSGEEELQLQIALAISKEEADKEMEARKNDDMRLNMALQESKTDDRRRPASTTGFMTGAGSSTSAGPSDFAGQSTSTKNSSALDDLLSLQPAVPAYSAPASGHNNAWGQPTGGDFFKATPLTSVGSDPWSHSGASGGVNPNDRDPFGDGTSANASGGLDYGSDPWSSSNQNGFGSANGQSNLNTSAGHGQSAHLTGLSAPDPWGSDALSPAPVNANNGGQSVTSTAEAIGHGQNRKLKTPDNFLGENAGLVNLDNLMAGSIKSTVPGMPPTKSGTTNPFALSSTSANSAASSNSSSSNNPFAPTNQQRATPPTLNEIRASSVLSNQKQPISAAGGGGASASGDPWANNAWTAPTTSPGSTNPFL